MLRSFSRSLIFGLAVCFCFVFNIVPAWGQTTTVATVTITVLDPSGAVVPNADLSLVNESTNVETKGSTTRAGTYSFEGVPIGAYRLTISKSGFASQEFDSVIAEAGRTTDLSATLKVGTAVESVKVNGAVTPLLETTSSAISTTIDMKQIEDLPLQGRDIFSLAFLTPGYASAPSVNGGATNTWNGLPVIAQGNNINGVVSSSARMKFDGNAQPNVSARLEDMQEMTVDTGQLNVSEGYGQAAMQSTFVSKNGTNNFHGGVYEDFQNAALNANSWTNNAEGLPRNPFILNDFGGNVGGPIIRNKLFFFASFAMSKQPGGYTTTDGVLTPAAQRGILTESTGQQVNLFTQVAQPNGLPTTINSIIASEISGINTAAAAGKLTTTSDPNYNQVAWFVPAPTTTYYPAVRVDYQVAPKLRVDFNWNVTKGNQPGADPAPFPGSNYATLGGSTKWNNYTAGIGVDWTISSTMLNQFRGGFLYDADWYGEGVGTQYLTQQRVFWPIEAPQFDNASGQTFPNLPVTTYYPVFNFSDNLTWQHSSHNFNFGVDWWREQDHYWNPPDGIVSNTLGLATGDPALNDFESYFGSAAQQDRTDAENLYATLVGRISGVNPGGGSGFPLNLKTGQFFTTVGEYPLDELMKTWGWYFHDSWHVKPTLTFNYGLRWDFTGDNHDLTGAYHSPDNAGIWGPSGVGNIFNPGVLNGTMDPTYDAREHVYNPWNVSPQPEMGIAWNPHNGWGKFGDGNTVIQAGYMLRRFTEPQQYYWDAASNYGFAYYQFFSLKASAPINGSQPTGTFAPGALALGDALPPFHYSIPSYETTVPEATQTWFGNGLSGIDQNIGQPYVQQWNVGIQRLLTHDNVLSVRYIGSHSVHEWILEDPNEANIFENGFLTQFKGAQTNLGINANHGIQSFANNGYAGQVPLPVFNAAFAGEASGGAGIPLADYGNSQFINYLNQGQAGAMAGTLDSVFGNAPYFCNLVGASFGPCSSLLGYTGAGAGYPINYFQANPDMSGSQILYMTDAGYGNYNALQVEFRQNPWHGMQFDANYTWGHALGVEPNGQWQGFSNFYTLRDPRMAYGPNPYDIRQVVHAAGTYDLPFGSGRTFLNSNGFVDRIVGGWSLGTILTLETGAPFGVNGGYETFNDYGDGGVILHNVTTSQLQGAIGTYSVPGAAFKDALPVQYLTGIAGAANPTYLTPNETPGTFGQHIWLYGPHFFNDDLALTKSTHINERLTFVLQGEFLNAFNHPNWGVTDYTDYHPSSILNTGFAQANVINSPRAVELRARLDF
ncbi:MAG: carboxypeptidase-like regulatory domain-containing protein [Candidatus Acidiferrales bacterium]